MHDCSIVLEMRAQVTHTADWVMCGTVSHIVDISRKFFLFVLMSVESVLPVLHLVSIVVCSIWHCDV